MNHRILITDDDKSLISAYQSILSRVDDLTVDYAQNATEAHNYMDLNEYDAAMFDIELFNDHKTGLDLLSEMKLKHPATPVMMMSAKDDSNTIALCLQLGAALFASKNCRFFAGFSDNLHHLLDTRKAA